MSNFSQLREFLSYLATIKGDLSSITAPPFVLAPKSAIEIPSAWASRHELFLQPAAEPDAAQRALLLAKNYICSLKQLVGQGSETTGKKPLNPFLGELFLAQFEGSQGTTKLITEQVSHHPPVTACFMYNRECGMSSCGFVAQELSFSMVSGVTVYQTGYAVVHDENHDEKHLMTMPTLHVKGIATGQPHSELGGPCYISSSSGFLTRIDFESKGHFGLGSKNQVKAQIYKDGDMKEPVFTICGQWNADLTIKNGKGDVVEEFHVDDVPSTSLSVKPVEEQTPWESRRAWKEVIHGIKTGNYEKVSRHKSAIEKKQRERRRREESQGIKWNRLFFSQSQHNDEVQKLIEKLPAEALSKVNPEKTAGVWSFVGVDAGEDVMRQLEEQPPPF